MLCWRWFGNFHVSSGLQSATDKSRVARTLAEWLRRMASHWLEYAAARLPSVVLPQAGVRNLERPCCKLRVQPAAHSPPGPASPRHSILVGSLSASNSPSITGRPRASKKSPICPRRIEAISKSPTTERANPRASLRPTTFPGCLRLSFPFFTTPFRPLLFSFLSPQHVARARLDTSPNCHRTFAPVSATRQPHPAPTPGRRPSPRRPQPFSLRLCHPLPSPNCQTSRFGRDRLCHPALRLPLRPRRTSLPGPTTPRLRSPTPRHAPALT